MAQPNDLACFRGEDITYTFTMNPVEDITAWTIAFTARRLMTDATALFTIAGSVTDASGGVFTIPLSAANTSQAPGQYVYDIWRTDSGSATPLSIGTWTIKQGVRTL